MVSFSPINIVDSSVDEIALEGLDGITLEALWKRVAQRFQYPQPLPESLMTQIWSICIQIDEISFYELETPRQPLVIFDRYEFIDSDLGIILEPENPPVDVYPHYPIHDVSSGIKGSCASYYTRKAVTDSVRNLSLDEAEEKYGRKLVIVASQAMREHALMGDDVCPTLELTLMQYCFLERVGRSRYHGEVTQGKLSLNALNEDPKSLFYHRKFLLRHKLITKQLHHQKSGSHSCNGSLVHLPRFYVERKPKVIFLAEQIIDILKSKPDYIAEYDEIKKKLQIESSIRKLYKTSFFQKVVRTDLRVPYRTLYPNAEPTEWQQKSYPTRERTIKVVQLIEPDIDISEVWSKDEIPDDDEPQEINISNHKYLVPFLMQANSMIEARKSEGVSQGSLGREMGLIKLQSRTVLRNLVKARILATYMDDVGRQRLAKFVSKKFEKGSRMSKEFKKEMNKIQELSKHIALEDGQATKSEMISRLGAVERTDPSDMPTPGERVSRAETGGAFDNNAADDKGAQRLRSPAESDVTFNCVNRILSKYSLTRYIRKYKRLRYSTESKTLLPSTSSDVPIRAATDSTVVNQAKGSRALSDFCRDERASEMYKNVKVEISTTKPLATCKRLNEVFGLIENFQKSNKQKPSNITYRLLRRANLIIESVKRHQVIDDVTKLMKLIHEEEDKEGYDVKIDKKSLLRLLEKLTKDNLVKTIKVVLSGNVKEKSLTFICDPAIDVHHTVIKSAIEQAKIKFCLMGARGIIKQHHERMGRCQDDFGDGEFPTSSSGPSLQGRAVMDTSNFQYDFKVAKRYGYIPKFVCMQALHKLLYYLVYDHNGEEESSKEEQIERLRGNGFNISDDVASECNKIYTKVVNWKMFIPPLPKHGGWPTGWVLMCDILLRMPLSIFLKIHFVHFVVPGIENYLNHPVKKHYLVRDLPASIRNILFYKRKYIFSVHQTAQKLCWMGLLQFGPQKLKEKDQVFMYINRKTELVDTTSSGLGYHKVEEKEYPVVKYDFDEMQTVEKYWYDMWNICMNTPLGGRLVVQGKEILLEDISKKSEMIDAASARTPEEAVHFDTGFVPGDRRGAAGIDSAFFSHLKRNWNWSLVRSYPISRQQTTAAATASVAAAAAVPTAAAATAPRGKTSFERDTYLSQIRAKPIKFTEFTGLRTVSGLPALSGADAKKKMRSQLEKRGKAMEKMKQYENLLLQASSRKKAVIRKIYPRKKAKDRDSKLKYDEIDYRALQRMNKLRVDWDPHEDKILLLCKVVMMYLCPNPHKQLITFTTVRDVLRQHSYKSYNKTSRACQRRLLYMMKQSKTMNSVALGIEEIKQNFFLSKRFNGIMAKIKHDSKSNLEYEKRIAETFKALADYVIRKYYDFSEVGPKEPFPVPKTAQEFNIFYKLVYPTKPFSNRGFVKDIQSVDDIHSATINSVIHSSMCCGKDKRSWAYQLFKVYQQYPELLLRNAMLKTRADQMVTIKKNNPCWPKKYSSCMPISSSQFQLSSNFIYKFHTKWPYPILTETYDVFHLLIKHYSISAERLCKDVQGIEIPKMTGGLIAAVHDYVTQDQVEFDIGIPNQIIMLDSEFQQSDEVYFKIAQRYHDVLTSLDNLYSREDAEPRNNQEPSSSAATEVRELRPKRLEESTLGANRVTYCQKQQDTPANIEGDHSRNPDDEGNMVKFEDGTVSNVDESSIRKRPLGQLFSERLASTRENLLGTKVNNTPNQQLPSLVTKERGPSDNNEVNSNLPDILHKKRSRPASEDTDVTNAAPVIKKGRKLEDATEIRAIGGNEKSADFGSRIPSETESNRLTSKRSDRNSEIEKQEDTDRQYVRTSEITGHGIPKQNYSNAYCKADDGSDTQRHGTRIALLRMREELNGLTAADSHHAHDFFVVNMFKIYYSLTGPKNSEETETFRGIPLPKELLPLSLVTINNLLHDINKHTLLPKTDTPNFNFKESLADGKQAYLLDDKVDLIRWFVRERKELGASIRELIDEFEASFGEELRSIVLQLTEARILLRTGVTVARYVDYRYADAWTISSYKMNRLERESLRPVPKGTVYDPACGSIASQDGGVAAAEEATEEKQRLASSMNEATISKVIFGESETVSSCDATASKSSLSSNLSEKTRPVRTRMLRRRARLLHQKESQSPRAGKQWSVGTAEEIRVSIRPWIRVDGILNRRVFDRMLGAVLTYCLTHPGVLLTKVQTRFVPALQPFHTRELVEMLMKLGCLEKKTFRKQRITLFSKPIPVESASSNTIWDPEEDIFLEPGNGAMLKFSIFLSTKIYVADFIK